MILHAPTAEAMRLELDYETISFRGQFRSALGDRSAFRGTDVCHSKERYFGTKKAGFLGHGGPNSLYITDLRQDHRPALTDLCLPDLQQEQPLSAVLLV